MMGTQTDKKTATKPPTGHKPCPGATTTTTGGGSVGGGGGRGRRRLDFKRFQGKTMFLDLPGYRHVARLEQELTSRGATLETHFHSGVKYLITMTRNGDSKNPAQSPSTPSPNTPGTTGISSISQLLSPATDYSPSDATPVRQGILTRSQQMLQLSRGRGGRRADLHSLAKQWGCKVVTLEELQGELKKLKPLPSSITTITTDVRRSQVRALCSPFLKVEDISRAYRPLILEMKRWPHPLCHASYKASPFDPPHLSRSIEHTTKQNAPHGGGKEKVNEKRPGHCECCSVKFEDLQMHLRSARHLEYAGNEENFKSLDHLIARGKTFDQFIHELRTTPFTNTYNGVPLPTYTPPQSTSTVVTTLSSSSSQPDSVVLVTMPTSHATPTRRRSPRKHPGTTPVPSPSHTPNDSTPVSRKRKSSSLKATPTNKKTTPTEKIFEITPTKKLRFSPEFSVPVKRRRSHTPSTTPTSLSQRSTRGSSVSPANKRPRRRVMTSSLSPSPAREGVRRSPRLLLKQLSPHNQSTIHTN